MTEQNEYKKKVKNIVMADEKRLFVIPSAPGKRFSGDTKVTDMLYECYNVAASGNSIDGLFAVLCERYKSIIRELGIDFDLTEEYDHIKRSIRHHAGRDYAASRGEYLNGLILAKYIGYDFIDPAYYVRFLDNGNFDAETTNSLLSE